MNNVLNGTGWGETPEPELKVPDLGAWRRELAIELAKLRIDLKGDIL